MTIDEFFELVCAHMGWEPTPWRIAVFRFWAGHEHSDNDDDDPVDDGGPLFTRAHNPLATTWRTDSTPLDLSYDNGFGPGNWNTVPVRVYASPQAGALATALTLQLFWYPHIRKCFEDQRGYQEAVGPHDFTSWIGPDVQYGQAIVDYMNSLSPEAQVLRWTRWPLDGDAIPNLITGPFGATSPNPPWTPARPHMGLDVGVFTGTPVYAPAAGKIVVPTNDGSFGIAVCIEHDTVPKWFSLYAHLSQALVFPGAKVHAGQRIALSGATPNVAPHLHWQLCRLSTFPRDLALNRDPLSVPFEEDDAMTPEEKTAFENLMLAAFSGSEEFALPREQRLVNANSRMMQRIEIEHPDGARQSISETAMSAQANLDAHKNDHPGGTVDDDHKHVPGGVIQE